jgi:hypothetical protein
VLLGWQRLQLVDVVTVDDEIGLLRDDILRYCNRDGRIDEALTMLCKLYQAEVDALAFEAKELQQQYDALVYNTDPWHNRRTS